MKLMILAAALSFGGAAMAQDAPMQTAPQAPTMADPVGGYQPAGPPMSGEMSAGMKPVFQQAPSVEQAYPPPAPMAKYPMCKKGQTDHCLQRGGR